MHLEDCANLDSGEESWPLNGIITRPPSHNYSWLSCIPPIDRFHLILYESNFSSIVKFSSVLFQRSYDIRKAHGPPRIGVYIGDSNLFFGWNSVAPSASRQSTGPSSEMSLYRGRDPYRSLISINAELSGCELLVGFRVWKAFDFGLSMLALHEQTVPLDDSFTITFCRRLFSSLMVRMTG